MLNLHAALVWSILPLVSANDVELPAPSGPFKTGRTSFHWKDASREELETKAAGDHRELMVHVFYPADTSTSGERATYVPDADTMQGPWKEEQIERIEALRAFSVENAPPAPGDVRYPVAIFLPGGGMKGLTYSVLVEDLASHGWIVAAIDPPYNAKGVRLPDGRVLGGLSEEERGWPQPKNGAEHEHFYRERIAHWSRDVSFVIDQLAELDRGEGPLAGRLDLARGVGVFGHSRGGQAAGAVRLLDDRVRGGINIDGTAGETVVQPVKEDAAGGKQPFLWIQSALPEPPTEEQLQRAGRTRQEYDELVGRILAAWDSQLNAMAGGAIRVYIDRPGISHIDFSDEPYWDGLMTPEALPGKLQSVRDTRAWVRAFLEGTVRGDWAALERLAGEDAEAHEHVTVQVYGRMWE